MATVTLSPTWRATRSLAIAAQSPGARFWAAAPPAEPRAPANRSRNTPRTLLSSLVWKSDGEDRAIGCGDENVLTGVGRLQRHRRAVNQHRPGPGFDLHRLTRPHPRQGKGG